MFLLVVKEVQLAKVEHAYLKRRGWTPGTGAYKNRKANHPTPSQASLTQDLTEMFEFLYDFMCLNVHM